MKKNLIVIFGIVLLFTQCKKDDDGNQNAKLPVEITAKLDSAVQAAAQNNIFDNLYRVVLKVDAGDNRTYKTGFDSRTDKTITEFDGLYEFGSCTKMLTATSIFQLIEANKLSLEDKLTEVLANDTIYENLLVINGVDYIDSVTIAQLLNHTSGLPDYFADDSTVIANYGNTNVQFTPYELVEMAKVNNIPTLAPGKGVNYCNLGYIFLGLIIEKLSGMKYEDYLQDHILDPLKMGNTYFVSTNPPAQREIGHYEGKTMTTPGTLTWAAGELISTLDDMNTFIRAWNESKLFSSETSQLLKNPSNFNDFIPEPQLKYGYGVMLLNNDSQTLGHEGGTFGFNTYIGYLDNGSSFSFAIDEGYHPSWNTLLISVTSILNSDEMK